MGSKNWLTGYPLRYSLLNMLKLGIAVAFSLAVWSIFHKGLHITDYQGLGDESCPNNNEWKSLLVNADLTPQADVSNSQLLANYYQYGWEECFNNFAFGYAPWNFTVVSTSEPERLGGNMPEPLMAARALGWKSASRRIEYYLEFETAESVRNRIYYVNSAVYALPICLLLLPTIIKFAGARQFQ